MADSVQDGLAHVDQQGDGSFYPITEVNGTVTTAPGVPTSEVGGETETTAGGAASISMPAVANKTNVLTGCTITTGVPTASGRLHVTITGLKDYATLDVSVMEQASIGGTFSKEFPVPLVASGPNVAITLTIPALTGGAIVDAELHGYQV